MSSTPTPDLGAAAPSLDHLVVALRDHAAAAAGSDQPTGPLADAYAHCASLLTGYVDRLRTQDPDRLTAPDLRARLAVAEAETTRTRDQLESAHRHAGDLYRAALDFGTDAELPADGGAVRAVMAERRCWRRDYDGAVALVAKMHAAAMGGVIRGPIAGVAEDVWHLRVALDQLTDAVEQHLAATTTGTAADAAREELLAAQLAATAVLQPADAEEHRAPIDTVNAIADVLTMRSALARIAVELDGLTRLPADERKARRETLVDLARELAGDPPYDMVLTRGEILLNLLHDGWGLIANAGVHLGGWDHEHPDWREAAEKWRDRFHLVTGAPTAPALEDTPAPTNECEADADAARRFAGELERLRAGLLELGITEGPGPWTIPAAQWPVTMALLTLRNLAAPTDVRAAP